MNLKVFSICCALGLVVAGFFGCNSGDPLTKQTPATMSVVSVQPLENQRNVLTSAQIRVTFEKPVDPKTLTQANFILSSHNGTTINGKIQYDSGSKTATYLPIRTLQESTLYEIVLNQVKGESGELVPPHVFTFTTAGRFQVTRVNPRDAEDSVKVVGLSRQDIAVIFNESVQNSLVTSANFYAREQSLEEGSFSNLLSATIEYDDTVPQLTLKPSRGRLRYSTRYFVTMRDVLSVSNARVDNMEWTFKTEEIRPSATIPTNDPSASAKQPTTIPITVLFPLAVDRSTIGGGIKLRKVLGSQQEFIFPAAPLFEQGDTKIILQTQSSGTTGLQTNTRYEILIRGVKTLEGELYQETRAVFTTVP